MFCYCLNNPVTRSDDGGYYSYYTIIEKKTEVVEEGDDGEVTYKTTIKYTCWVYNEYAMLPLVDSIEGEVELIFSVDSRGTIIFDCNQKNGSMVREVDISLALAEEMYYTATKQVEGALSGRTISKMARELRVHRTFSFLGSKVSTADLGGLDKSRSDYDYNGRMFENLWKFPGVLWEMLQK